jgi:hypothetical protein
VTDGPANTYTDSGGWTIDVSPGWLVTPFETSKGKASASGVQVSNADLPSPSIVPGFPIQALGGDLPSDGVALIIATDVDPGDAQQPPPSPVSPPLSVDQFLEGSAAAGAASLDLLWFSGNGQTFLATIKSGAAATSEDRTDVAAMVASLRFGT